MKILYHTFAEFLDNKERDSDVYYCKIWEVLLVYIASHRSRPAHKGNKDLQPALQQSKSMITEMLK